MVVRGDIMKLLLGTKNKNKIIEMSRILKECLPDLELDIISLKDFDDVEEPIEDGTTFSENAVLKAKYYYDIFKIPTIADDSGISVNALDGRPGIYSARYASTTNENSSSKANRDKLLDELKDKDDRSAYYTCAIALYYGDDYIVTEDYTYGEILFEEVGSNGFGYDYIFHSTELNKSMGIATDEEKDSISHRAKAIRKLIKLIDEQKSTKL